MTEADISPSLRTAPDRSLKNGHLLRSRLLDEFARLETSVSEFLAHLNIKFCETAPLRQRLSMIDESVVSGLKNPGLAEKIVNEALKLADMRNSIVHAKLRGTSQKDQKLGWKFINAGKTEPSPLVLTPDDFEQHSKAVNRLSLQFKQLKP